MMDMILEPELAQLIIDKVTDVIIRLNEIYLNTISKYIDIIEIPGDDYGGMEDILILPAIFEKMLRPVLKRIIRPIKKFRGDLFVAFHNDGPIMKLLESFIELGIDILHPIEPLQANDMKFIKEKYGHKLAFMGAIDIKKALPGSIGDIE